MPRSSFIAGIVNDALSVKHDLAEVNEVDKHQDESTSLQKERQTIADCDSAKPEWKTF